MKNKNLFDIALEATGLNIDLVVRELQEAAKRREVSLIGRYQANITHIGHSQRLCQLVEADYGCLDQEPELNKVRCFAYLLSRCGIDLGVSYGST